MLTYCPTMHSIQQRKLKLLMPVLLNRQFTRKWCTHNLQSFLYFDWEQGWRSGESTRLLLMWLGIDSQTQRSMTCGLSLLLVLFSALRGFFSRYSIFPSPQMPTFPNSNLIQISVNLQSLCGGATANSHYYSHYYLHCAIVCFSHFTEIFQWAKIHFISSLVS